MRNDLLQKNIDLEAVEYALRKSDKPYLTWKIHMLLFFAETTKGYYDNFYNQKNDTIKAFISLSFYFFRSIVKLIKGKFLIKVYKIA